MIIPAPPAILAGRQAQSAANSTGNSNSTNRRTGMAALPLGAAEAICTPLSRICGPPAGASPSGKAPVFGTGIRRFESCRPSQPSLAARASAGQASFDIGEQRAKAVPPKLQRRRTIQYVYTLQSLSTADHYYAGCTNDMPDRVRRHNSGFSGISIAAFIEAWALEAHRPDRFRG